MKVLKADQVNIIVEKILFSTNFEGHFCAVQALLGANVKLKVILKDAVKTVKELLQSGRSIDKLEYSVTTAKLTVELQRMAGPVKSKDLELQAMPGSVEEVSRLWE